MALEDELEQRLPALVLASASPRRRQLLESAGYQFRVQASDVEEPPASHFPTPEAYVAHTAWLKCAAIVGSSEEWVLAADTVAAIEGDILGKPADVADAARILGRLAGTKHRVLTGVCLWVPHQSVSLLAVETTWVEMKSLSGAEIEAYLATGLWEGKAGAYGIQDHDDPFVTAVEGSYSNVMGLPMEKLRSMLESARELA